MHEGREQWVRAVESSQVPVGQAAASDATSAGVAVQTAQLGAQALHGIRRIALGVEDVQQLGLHVVFSGWSHLRVESRDSVRSGSHYLILVKFTQC